MSLIAILNDASVCPIRRFGKITGDHYVFNTDLDSIPSIAFYFTQWKSRDPRAGRVGAHHNILCDSFGHTKRRRTQRIKKTITDVVMNGKER